MKLCVVLCGDSLLPLLRNKRCIPNPIHTWREFRWIVDVMSFVTQQQTIFMANVAKSLVRCAPSHQKRRLHKHKAISPRTFRGVGTSAWAVLCDKCGITRKLLVITPANYIRCCWCSRQHGLPNQISTLPSDMVTKTAEFNDMTHWQRRNRHHVCLSINTMRLGIGDSRHKVSG